MSHERRNYGQYCGLASTLDVIGERWTLLIIRELLTGSCRYNELLASLPGIGTNLLADRLKYLGEMDLIRQREPADGSKVRRYELTEFGQTLREPVLALARWGLKHMGTPGAETAVRPRWGMLAVEAMIDPEVAARIDEEYEFRIDDEVFHVEVRHGDVRVLQGPATTPAFTATTDARTFVEIGAGVLSPLDAALTQRLIMAGDKDAVIRCTELLGLTSRMSPSKLKMAQLA